MKKKIGIITEYYVSANYGGLLQSYALVKFLQENGYSAKQICYDCFLDSSQSNKKKKFNPFSFFKTLYSFATYRLFIKWYKKSQIRLRDKQFKKFKETFIDHTSDIYDCNSIEKCQDFDVYIAGSDQIWLSVDNSMAKGYWLNFVSEDKTKITYAASPTLDYLSPKEQKKASLLLQDYKAISIREKSGINILKQLLLSSNNANSQRLAKEIQVVLDPVFLLSKKQWNVFSDDNPYKNKKYVFAYLLGHSRADRRFVKKFCKKNDYTLIDSPHIYRQFRFCDANFADIEIYDAMPNLFVSLIRDAEYIFADSFHACAFSLIFNKRFYVFDRLMRGVSGKNNRITDLLDTFDCMNRHISSDCPYTDELNENLLNRDINYKKINLMIKNEQKKSSKFLFDHLSD